MVTPKERDIWARFRPAVQHAGGMLGQGFGQAIQLPGVRHVLGGLSAIQERGVNPFMSQVIAGLPFAKDPARRWEAYKTPGGDLSWSGVLQANPLALGIRGLQGIAAENIPQLREMRIGPQGTMKAQRLASEEARIESQLGRPISPTERRMLEEKEYALAKHVRGGIQELPWFFLPSAGAARKASVAARAGQALSSAGRLGRAAPLARGGLRAAEVALRPIEAIETVTAKAVAAPFRAAGRAVSPVTRQIRPLKAGVARGFRPGSSVESAVPEERFYRAGGRKEAEVRAGLGEIETGVVPAIRSDVAPASLQEIYGISPLRATPAAPEYMTSATIRGDARRILRQSPDIDLEDAFELSDAKYMAPTKGIGGRGELKPKQIFSEEYIYQKNPKATEMGYRSARAFRSTLGKTRTHWKDTGTQEVLKSIHHNTLRNVANKIRGGDPDSRLNKALNGIGKVFSADSAVRLKAKLHDAGTVTRVAEDSKGRAQTFFSEKYLSSRYVPISVKITRALGMSAQEGYARYINHHETAMAKARSAGVSDFEVDRMVQANRLDEIRGKYPDRIEPQIYDRYIADDLNLDFDKDPYIKGIKTFADGSKRDAFTSPAYKSVADTDVQNWKGSIDVDNYDRWYKKPWGQGNQGTDLSKRTEGYTRAQYDALVEAAEARSILYTELRVELNRAGVLSDDLLKEFEKNHKYYTPMHYLSRLEDGASGVGRVVNKQAATKFNATDSGIERLSRRLDASEEQWIPPSHDALLYDLVNARQRIARNRVTGQAVRLFRDEFGLKDVTDNFTKYRVAFKAKNVDDQFLTKSDIEAIDKNFSEWGPDYTGRKTLMHKGKVIDTNQYVEEVYEKLTYDEAKKSGFFSFFENGQRRVYGDVEGDVIPRSLWEAINGRSGLVNKAEKEGRDVFQKANGFMRSVHTTYNPLFALRNSMIDTFTASLHAGVGPSKSGMRLIKALGDVKGIEKRLLEKQGATLADMKMATGINTVAFYPNQKISKINDVIRQSGDQGVVVTSQKQARDVLRKASMAKLRQWIPNLGSALEEAPRLAVFEKSLTKSIGSKELKRLTDLRDKDLNAYKKQRDVAWTPEFDAQNRSIARPQPMDTGFKDVPEFQKAAQNSIEVTLDFSRGGEMIRKMNEYILFLNASMEGSKLPFRALGFDISPIVRVASPAKKARAMARVTEARARARAKAKADGVEYVDRITYEPPLFEWGSWSDQARKYARLGFGERGMTGIAMDNVNGGPKMAALRLGAAMSAYLTIQNQHNKQFVYDGTPIYYDISNDIRDNALVYLLDSDRDETGEYIINPRTGRPTPKYFVFPHKTREWNIFFQAANLLDEQAEKTVPKDYKKFFDNVASSSSPLQNDLKSMLLPELVQIIGEEVTGQDWYRDKDIVNEEFQQLPPEQQYDKYTSKFWRRMAGVLDDLPDIPIVGDLFEPFDEVIGSPQRLEHLYENVFGSVGREAINTVEWIIASMNGLAGKEKRPMQDMVKSYREDMTNTERKEFLVTLTESEQKEFARELKEADDPSPFLGAIRSSYYPERGGELRSMARRQAERDFPEIERAQNIQAGIQASKDRSRLKIRQDEDDEALANWKQGKKGKKLNPAEWRDKHSNKWMLYEYDLEKISEKYPKSIYAQSDEVRNAYYDSIYTLAGQMKDSRDATDLLLAGYYAIQSPAKDPNGVDWDSFYRTRDEYTQRLKVSSEASGDGLFNEFMRRKEANNTETEKAYYRAMKITSRYWNVGKRINELYPAVGPRSDLQKQWDEYLDASVAKKDELRKKSPVIRDMVKKRSKLRRDLIKQDERSFNGFPVLESALVYWYGADYYRKPITLRGDLLFKQLYLGGVPVTKIKR